MTGKKKKRTGDCRGTANVYKMKEKDQSEADNSRRMYS